MRGEDQPGDAFGTMPDVRVHIADYLDMIRVHERTIAALCGLR